MVQLVYAWLQRAPGLVIVIDAKANRRYDGLCPGRLQVRESVAHLRAEPLPPGTRVVVYRGNPFRGQDVDPDRISEAAWATAGQRCPVLLVHDELVPFAAKNGQWLRGDKSWVQRSLITGREHGVSVFWATTGLVSVPLDASGQSEILAFQCTPNDTRLLTRRGYCTGLPPGTLERLPGPPLPFGERGVFVRLQPEQPWDGLLYKAA